MVGLIKDFLPQAQYSHQLVYAYPTHRKQRREVLPGGYTWWGCEAGRKENISWPDMLA